MTISLKQLIGLAAAAALCTSAQALDVAAECDSCHGTNGVSEWNDVPTIAGFSLPVLEDAMFAYMDEARPCSDSEYRQGDTSRAATNMCAIAGSISEDDIAAAAEHYESQTFVAAKQEFDAAKAEAGMAVHEASCDKCHSAGGSDAADDAGILAGQWMGYLETSMAQFRSGEREQPKSMKTKLDELSDADVEALIHYYASQQ